MKITKEQLKHIIKEELSQVLKEGATMIESPNQIAAAIKAGGRNAEGMYASLVGGSLILVGQDFVTIKQTPAGPEWSLGKPQRADGGRDEALWVIRSVTNSVDTANRLKWKEALIAAGVPEKNIKVGHH